MAHHNNGGRPTTPSNMMMIHDNNNNRSRHYYQQQQPSHGMMFMEEGEHYYEQQQQTGIFTLTIMCIMILWTPIIAIDIIGIIKGGQNLDSVKNSCGQALFVFIVANCAFNFLVSSFAILLLCCIINSPMIKYELMRSEESNSKTVTSTYVVVYGAINAVWAIVACAIIPNAVSKPNCTDDLSTWGNAPWLIIAGYLNLAINGLNAVTGFTLLTCMCLTKHSRTSHSAAPHNDGAVQLFYSNTTTDESFHPPPPPQAAHGQPPPAAAAVPGPPPAAAAPAHHAQPPPPTTAAKEGAGGALAGALGLGHPSKAIFAELGQAVAAAAALAGGGK